MLVATIEIGGEPAFTTMFAVSDSEAPAVVWQSLEGQAWEAVGARARADDDAPGVTLEGEVRVILTHSQTTFAAVDLARLELVAQSPAAARWQLAPGEVERTAALVR